MGSFINIVVFKHLADSGVSPRIFHLVALRIQVASAVFDLCCILRVSSSSFGYWGKPSIDLLQLGHVAGISIRHQIGSSQIEYEIGKLTKARELAQVYQVRI